MPPGLYACGSNAASHLSINHPEDVSTLTPTIFHPSLPDVPESSRIIDLVSTSAHSLLLLSTPISTSSVGRKSQNVLLGAGTNTFGQLGPRCALWDDVKPEPRWKSLNLLSSSDIQYTDDWEPVKIASTWTTSFVVYQRLTPKKVSDGMTGSSSGSAANTHSTSGEDEDQVEQIMLSCGSNDFGELGSSAQIPETLNAPAEIPISQSSQKPTVVGIGLRIGEKVEYIKGGQRHVIVVIDGKDGQRVIGWGASRKGELDISTLSDSLPDDSAASSPNNRIKGKGKAKGKGKGASRPNISPPTLINLPIPPNAKIIDIALGASHTLALLDNGKIFAWGSNLKGQVNKVHQLEGIIGIAATWGGSYLLNNNNEVLSQGSNSHSQLLRITRKNPSERGKVELPDGLKVKRIVAGSEHLLVHMINDKNNNGNEEEREESLWSGGWNEHGNLALGDQIDRSKLEQVPINGHGSGRIKGIWGGCASTWVWMGKEM